MSPAHRPGGEITAIGRATALLRAFRDGRGTHTVTSLAHSTGMAKSSVHRLTAEMVRCGLLERDGTNLRLSLLLFEFGQQVTRQYSFAEAARPYMSDLREATRQNVALAVLEEGDVVYIELLRGKDGPHVPQRVGSRWPAHASAAGKAILAFLTPERLSTVTATGLRRLTEHTIVDTAGLDAELERIRRRGVAFDQHESFQRVVSAAAPVFDLDERVLGALAVSGLSGRIDLRRVEVAVKAGALAISRDLTQAGSLVPNVLRSAIGRTP